MGNPTDEIVVKLEHDWPDWQIWVVHRVVGGPVWCARRWDWQPGDVVLNADSAGHLVEYLEAETSGQP
jgi:hypothetical protein